MTEKKIVVYDLRLAYNGPVSIQGFYKEVDDWIKEKGMQREMKTKREYVTNKGKEIEWIIEAWKDLTEYARDVVSMRALFHHVKEVDIEKNGKKMRINEADVLLTFNGILETQLSRRWEQRPVFFFVRALVDKYIWKFHTEKFFDVVYSDTHELHKRLKAFLSLGKYKVI